MPHKQPKWIGLAYSHTQDLSKSGLPAALLICSWGRANCRYPAGADNKVPQPSTWAAKCHSNSHSLWGVSSSCKMQLVSRASAFPLLSCYNREWQRPSAGVPYSSAANNVPHCACWPDWAMGTKTYNQQKHINKDNESLGTRDYSWRPTYHRS